jgi:hypothetical protein
MTCLVQSLRNLAWDMLVFAEMAVYWPFAVIIMLPLRHFDRRFGTRLFSAVDRAMRSIADL